MKSIELVIKRSTSSNSKCGWFSFNICADVKCSLFYCLIVRLLAIGVFVKEATQTNTAIVIFLIIKIGHNGDMVL